MLLTPEELSSLVNLQLRNPHAYLGMHPLGDGSGVVVRALIPGALGVSIRPTHEKPKPAFKLKRVHEDGVFEGTSRETQQVYAYDLIIDFGKGSAVETRDPYSFLPVLGETDL